MDQETRNHFTYTEIATYVLASLIIGVGICLALIDDAYFRRYVIEDGFLENATAVLIAVSAIIVLVRFFRTRHLYPWTFSAFSLTFAALLIFVAGEEISWGQRIFNIESNEFFLSNNKQNETNLHNMVIGDVSLNKVLSKIAALFTLVFYVIIPPLYARRGFVHRWLAPLYVPIPKIHHGLALLIFGIIIDQIPSGKRGELNEVTVSLFVLLLIFFAQNVKHKRRT